MSCGVRRSATTLGEPGIALFEQLEAAKAHDPVQCEAVIDLVTGLVPRSVVAAEDHGLGVRYRLLETIRQYGEERLVDCGETQTLPIRHAHFYAVLSVRAAFP
jgi:non-specific serine/threonine protein kinase